MNKQKISAVINTYNEGKLLENCLKSLNFVDEIVIVDMGSTDNTIEIASKYTSSIFKHKHLSFVEPARNFGVRKATGAWIFVIDPDERVPSTLANKLLEIANQSTIDYMRLPRKNIIFSKWIEHSRWWPDYNIRFFRRGSVVWQDVIHTPPVTTGKGVDLEANQKYAIEHYHYPTIDDYLQKNHRYTNQQSKELIESGYKFDHLDLISKPSSEFISRYFAGEGYKDGLHGFVLAILQAFSVFLVYLKVWEAEGFKSQDKMFSSKQFINLVSSKFSELKYWIYTVNIHLSETKMKKVLLKIRRKFNL